MDALLENTKIIKDKILLHLNGMGNDSKRESYEHEKILCNILTLYIEKKKSVEHNVGCYVMDYPDKITDITYGGPYKEIPCIIYCNEDDFQFHTEWIDMDYRAYFEKLKYSRLDYLEGLIHRVEMEVLKHQEKYSKLLNLEYEN